MTGRVPSILSIAMVALGLTMSACMSPSASGLVVNITAKGGVGPFSPYAPGTLIVKPLGSGSSRSFDVPAGHPYRIGLTPGTYTVTASIPVSACSSPTVQVPSSGYVSVTIRCEAP